MALLKGRRDVSAPVMMTRRVAPEDTAGVAPMVRCLIQDGRHSLRDTPLSADDERALFAALPPEFHSHRRGVPAGPAARRRRRCHLHRVLLGRDE
jgi:hypothetical protein